MLKEDQVTPLQLVLGCMVESTAVCVCGGGGRF